jgi:hypothetical protein
MKIFACIEDSQDFWSMELDFQIAVISENSINHRPQNATMATIEHSCVYPCQITGSLGALVMGIIGLALAYFVSIIIFKFIIYIFYKY